MTKEEFINKVASSVMKYAPQFNIKVCSPIIAQACLESAYGTSNKAKYHNYFGLKYRKDRVTCHSGYFNDGSVEHNNDGSYTPISTDWYKFSSLDQGILGYFQFINISTYANVKGVSDPKDYITKLRNDGYATDLQYVSKIMKVIQDNNLTKFDNNSNNQGEMVKMSYTFKENLVSSSKYSTKCPYSLTPKYITIHNTSNDAPAANEINYMRNNNNATSFHLAVDDREVIQGIPFNRNAWHCGDGSGASSGNRTSIGIEICYSKSGGSRYTAAEENAVYVAARMLYRFGLGIDRLRTHKSWSGKNCPHRILDEGRWESFKSRVSWVLNEIKAGRCASSLTNGSTSVNSAQPAAPAPSQPSTSSSSLTGSNFTVRIKVASLNIRKEASFDSAVVGTVKKGDVFTITETKSGLGRLKSGAGWISMGTAYVEKVGNVASSSSPSSSTYKAKVVNCSVLNARAGAGTQYKVVETVKAGTVLTIVGETNGWLKTKSGLYVSKTYMKRI